MNSNFPKHFFYLVLAVIAVLLLPKSNSYAQGKFAGIKTVIVLDFADKTGKFKGDKIADLVRQEMSSQAKFKVLSKSETLARFKKLKISRTKMLTASYRKAVAKYLKVDAFVLGTITKEKYYRLTLKMERSKTQAAVNISYVDFKNEVGPTVSKVATAKFLGLSYQTAPTERIAAPPIRPEPSATTPSEKAEVTKALPGRTMPQEEETAPSAIQSFTPKGEEKEAYEAGAVKRDLLTLKFAPALLKNSYSVVNPDGSTVAKPIGISTGFFSDIYFTGDLWFIRYLGIDFTANYGFLTLKVTPPGGTTFNVSTKFTQFGGGVKYRYFFMDDPKSPYAFARIGYSIQKLSPGTQATNVLSGNKYTDISFGIGAKVPFWFLKKPDLGLNFGFDYFLSSSLTETVINNGTKNSSSGYQIALGPYWKFYKSLFTSFDFTYNKHSASFKAPDATSRADVVENAKSSDAFTGILLSFGVNL